MIYSRLVSTPANTPIETPQVTELEIVAGVLYKAIFYFPPGPSGLVGICIYDDAVQLYPRNRGEYFVGDNVSFEFEDLYEFTNPEKVLNIYTYNLDTQYCHGTEFIIGVTARDVFISSMVPGKQLEALAETVDSFTEKAKAVLPPVLPDFITGN